MGQLLPDWAQAAFAWLLQPVVLAALAAGSVLLFIGGVVGVRVVLTRMPADFLTRAERRRAGVRPPRRPLWVMALRAAKNALGGVLFVLGVVMLVAPGPGLVTILVALFLLDFPGKRKLQRWILARPGVHRRINAVRHRAGRPPLELPIMRRVR
jgi:hypothetical protein